MPPIPPITKALMLACVGMFCVTLLYAPIGYWLALWPLASGNFMPWQVITYAFLHGDPTHLFFNMFGLWTFGSELEQLWGRQRYLRFMGASVLAAALTQLLFTAVVGTLAPTVGISGGLFGLLLAYGMLFPHRTIMPLIPPIPMKAKTFVMVFGAIELLFGLWGRDGIAHFAHLGGMLGGWLMLRFWRGASPFDRRRRR